MDWVCSISTRLDGAVETSDDVALKMHTMPNREMVSTIISSGQSKYRIRLRSKRFSRMY